MSILRKGPAQEISKSITNTPSFPSQCSIVFRLPWIRSLFDKKYKLLSGVEVGCAGTLDRLALFPWDPRPWVIDLKTGKAKLWHPLQLAGYCYAAQKEYRMMAVYIDGYGVFRAEEYREERYLRIFKCALDFINSELQAGRRI